MADRIVLQGVSARGNHGVLDAEKRDGQTFLVDVMMLCDLEPAGRTDALEATVNYAEVANDVVARITGPSFDLIERLAEVIALAVASICIWGTLIGSMLPLAFKRMGIDPGIASSPFVATFVDVTGIIIYFTIAKIYLL